MLGSTSRHTGAPCFIASPAMLVYRDTMDTASGPGRSRSPVTKRPLPQRRDSLRGGRGRAAQPRTAGRGPARRQAKIMTPAGSALPLAPHKCGQGHPGLQGAGHAVRDQLVGEGGRYSAGEVLHDAGDATWSRQAGLFLRSVGHPQSWRLVCASSVIDRCMEWCGVRLWGPEGR